MSVNFSLEVCDEVPKTIVEHTQSSGPQGTLSSVGEPAGTSMILGCNDPIDHP